MQDIYKFNLGQTSLLLGSQLGHSYQQHQALEPRLKPVFAMQTQGWPVIDLPGELVKALGRRMLHKSKSAGALLSAHFETEQAIYQLHVSTRVQRTCAIEEWCIDMPITHSLAPCPSSPFRRN